MPTFDNSILTNANVVGITNAINGAIQVFQSNLLDDVTVNITFTSDETVGLGQSVIFGFDFNYGDFITALKSHAASSHDAIAYSNLPNSAVDPVIGGTQIHVTTALKVARARLFLYRSGFHCPMQNVATELHPATS